MNLALRTFTIPDPDGHGAALALRGDWLVVAVSDGDHVGAGEASHSGDDARCAARIRELFDRHVRRMSPSPEAIRELEAGAFAEAEDLLTATAISALDQALHDLAARRAGVPVWELFRDAPIRPTVPVYVTLNRALRRRDDADYLEAVDRVLEMGVREVKVAPFDAVATEGDQLATAGRGLAVLRMLRETWPELGLRVDFHERLEPRTALALLPELEALDLQWIEAPCPLGPVYAEIRERVSTPVAAGELFFGTERFVEIAACGWVDVVMPDIKHVGGLGPLLAVAEAVRSSGVEVSPHNPSGDVSTLATVHAAALAVNVTSIELPLHGPGHTAGYLDLIRHGEISLPPGPGWGRLPDEIVRRVATGADP